MANKKERLTNSRLYFAAQVLVADSARNLAPRWPQSHDLRSSGHGGHWKIAPILPSHSQIDAVILETAPTPSPAPLILFVAAIMGAYS
ncbi:MAG: hypothetical protein DMG89_14470 [Acidobacteria bacterium]|nr:MAG: hypothetical protein DMG89_14470 [Acidobacteriota bacterium]